MAGPYTRPTASDPGTGGGATDATVVVDALADGLEAAETTLAGLGGAAVLDVGTSSGTVAAGDDARLSDARTPTAHAASHLPGGSDTLAVPLMPLSARSGWYYTVTGTTSASAAINQRMYLTPIWLPAMTADQIGAEVTAAGTTAFVRLGIYLPDAYGAPGNLLLDAGTIDGSTVAIQTISISQTLAGGLYWLAGCAQSVSSTGNGRFVTPAYQLSAVSATPMVTPPGCFSQAGVAGALPSTVGTLTALATGMKIFLRSA